MDLRGAFENPEQPHVAVHARDDILVHVSGAAEDLHRAVGDAADHFGREEFAGRHVAERQLAGIAPQRRLQDHRASGQVLRLTVRQHVLDGLEFGDRLFELNALQRVGERFLDQPGCLADTGRGDMHPRRIDPGHGGLEALPLFRAQEGGSRNAALVEEDVAGVRGVLPHLAVVPAGAEPRRVGLDDEGGNSSVAGIRLAGARHDDEDVSVWRIGDVALLAIDHVFVAVAPRPRRNPAGIRTGAGLGQAEGPGPFAACHLRQVGVALVRPAAEQDRLRG